MRTSRRELVRIVAFASAGAVMSCSKQGPPPTLPPPEVAVVQVTPQKVEELFEFPGTVEARRSVDVRAQVSGVIVARPFSEGQSVRVGQVLYRIDPIQYDADWR